MLLFAIFTAFSLGIALVVETVVEQQLYLLPKLYYLITKINARYDYSIDLVIRPF